jgi:predicted dehydrogenase
MKPLKVAVIGAGHLGRIHARILKSLPNFDLAAIVDPVESLRREVAEMYDAWPCVHFGEVLGRVDAAVIATPTRKHHEVGVQLLKHGIHLFVEKPLAASVAEADELIQTAREQRLVLQTGHVERFNPAFTHVQAECYEPKYIEACRTSSFKFRSTDIGAVLDLMIHDIDLVLTLVRSPLRQVDAIGISVFGQYEDVANARLQFENGCVATLNASRASYEAARTMQIWNERSFAAIDFATRSGTIVRPHDSLLERRFSLASLTPDQVERLKDHLFEDLLPLEHFQAPAQDQITLELEDFSASILEGRPPRVTGEHGREALVVAQRVLDSLAAHRWDGKHEGRTGPHAIPSRHVLQGPHWRMAGAPQPVEWREAG